MIITLLLIVVALVAGAIFGSKKPSVVEAAIASAKAAYATVVGLFKKK